MNTLKRGLYTGLKTTWELSKVVFPVTVLVKSPTTYPCLTLDNPTSSSPDEMDWTSG